MPVTIHLNGVPYHADDGTDPMELQQYAQQHQMERAQLNPMNQGLQNVFAGMNEAVQDYQNAPTPTAIPSNVNTYGMTPQQLTNTAQMIQQDNQFSATQKLQERAMRQREVEAEKDRAQQFQIEQKRHQNTLKETEFRYRQQLDVLDQEQRAGKADIGPDGAIYWIWKDENGIPRSKLIQPGQGKSPKMDFVTQPDGTQIYTELSPGTIQYPEPNASDKPKMGFITQADGTQIYGELTPGTVQYPKPTAADKPEDIDKLISDEARSIRSADRYDELTEEQIYSQAVENIKRRREMAAQLSGVESITPIQRPAGVPANAVPEVLNGQTVWVFD